MYQDTEASFPSPSADPINAYQDIGGAQPRSKTNPTFLPDGFLLSWQPLFLIRHPALTFESWYRMELQVTTVELDTPPFYFFTSYNCTRQLYDWYASKVAADHSATNSDVISSKPLVIDADDIMQQASLERLCELIKTDPSSLLLNWEVTKKPESMNPRLGAFMTFLWQSTSIDRSKSSAGIDLAARHEQWKVEFGAEAANLLLQRVNNAMEDYNYLHSRKI